LRFPSLATVALLFAAFASATPITLIFTGTASGTVGSTSFTNDTFNFTFTSDTTALVTPPDDTEDIATPNPTANTFTIGSLSGSLTGLPTFPPAVFLNTTTQNVGIFFYNDGDWLATASSEYTSSFGLVNNLTVDDPMIAFVSPSAMGSTAGDVTLTSVSDMTFQEIVTPAPTGSSGTTGTTGTIGSTGSTTPTGPLVTSDAPEPSTLALLGIGFGGLLIGRLRRRPAKS
jgi:PEP-CTERM motif